MAKYIVGKKTKMLRLYLPSFSHFYSISYSSVIHMEICVKDFSGTTAPSTNVGYDLLYCVQESQSPPAYHSLSLSICLSQIKFSVTDFSASMTVRIFKFCIHIESGQFIVEQKTRC